jgi:hypothetical protein
MLARKALFLLSEDLETDTALIGNNSMVDR